MRDFQKRGILLFCLFAFSQAFAGSAPDTLFTKANEFFAGDLYSDAAVHYLKIIDAGCESAEVYYNLGNAYFKMSDLPNAILYYEKAKKLSPNDEDILYNLQVANARISDKIEPVPELFLKKWWRNLYTASNSQTWASVCIILLFLFFTGISVYLLSKTHVIRKVSFYCALFMLAFSVLFFILASTKFHYETSSSEAIVFSPTITVKSSPRENSVDLFVIHEGTKVTITEEFPDWFEIRIASGSVGWLPAQSVKKI